MTVSKSGFLMNSGTCHPSPRRETFGADQTHKIALAPSNRLIRHSPDLGWENVYASVAIEEPWQASLPARKHNCIAFCLNQSAKIVRTIEGQGGPIDRLLAPRQFGVIPSGTPSHWDVRGSPEIMLIYLRDSMLERVANDVFNADLQSFEIIPRLAEVDPLLEQLALSILDVLRQNEARSGLFVDSLAYTMSVQLLRKHAGSSRSTSSPHIPVMTQKLSRMKRLEEFIDANLGENLGLARLAGEVGLNPYHFLSSFGRSFGMSPHQYVVRKRVERAQQLLRTTDLAIVELSLRCGFSSQSHLTSTFKRFVGMPPHAYRKLSR